MKLISHDTSVTADSDDDNTTPTYEYSFKMEDSKVEVTNTTKILGVVLYPKISILRNPRYGLKQDEKWVCDISILLQNHRQTN